jgi:hypothetical protein
MRKALLVCFILSLIWGANGFLFAQVVADFEDGTTQGYFDNGWGSGFTDVSYLADPTGRSTGVLALTFDGTAGQKGDLQVDNLEPMGAHLLMYWIYLPADTPDSLTIKLWAQDNNTWTWKDRAFSSGDIPNETWYPLVFDMEAFYAADPSTFDHHANKLGKSGVEIANWDEHDDDANWAGTIYVDDISLVGVEPSTIADFEDGTVQNYFDNGWGSGFTDVSAVTDPTGGSDYVLSLTFDGTAGQKGDLQIDNLVPAGFNAMVYWVYLPADCPDSLTIKLWAQDNGTWTWKDKSFSTGDIPNETWYPLYFNMEAFHAMDPSTFDHYANKLGKSGIEIANWNEHDDDANWSGAILFDNIAFIGLEVGAKWVVADFENETAGTQGFADTGWGAGLRAMNWLADPSGRTAGVLNTDWDFGQGEKGAFEHGNVDLGWTDTDTGATAITIDIWLPADIPLGAQVSMFLRDHDTWTWTEDKVFINDTTLVRGQWNTFGYDVMAHVDAAEVNPTVGVSVGCQIYYAEANTWTGSVYWDNFTLIGVEEPVGDVLSPLVEADVDTFTAPGVPFYYVNINWVDNTVGTETYNVYMSHSPIADLGAEGVVRIAREVPHGEESWNYRPFTTDGAEGTFYFAVTATTSGGEETELNEQCKTGAITIPTSVTAKVQYVADFATQFTLDGLDTEFADYKDHTLQPERAGGDDSEGWTPESTDMSYNATFVMDDDYLYISADVTDDDLNAAGSEPLVSGSQAWMGDALEFFIGFYDTRDLDALHGYRDVGAMGTGDWRIAFTAWGTTEKDGYQPYTFPGLENTVYQKFTGDGYIIEARLALDSLAGDHNFVVEDGMMLPLRIDGTDMDPGDGETERSMNVMWGSMWNSEDWKRPSTFGMLEVINGPGTGVGDVAGLPREFRLYENYPNPFNPSTSLKYQLAKATTVTIKVYNMLGKEVKTLVDKRQAAGTYTIQWDGTSDPGRNVASGIYFCKMVTPEYTRTHKMMLLK